MKINNSCPKCNQNSLSVSYYKEDYICYSCGHSDKIVSLNNKDTIPSFKKNDQNYKFRIINCTDINDNYINRYKEWFSQKCSLCTSPKKFNIGVRDDKNGEEIIIQLSESQYKGLQNIVESLPEFECIRLEKLCQGQIAKIGMPFEVVYRGGKYEVKKL